jgi:preprotein translocase subunit SecG
MIKVLGISSCLLQLLSFWLVSIALLTPRLVEKLSEDVQEALFGVTNQPYWSLAQADLVIGRKQNVIEGITLGITHLCYSCLAVFYIFLLTILAAIISTIYLMYRSFNDRQLSPLELLLAIVILLCWLRFFVLLQEREGRRMYKIVGWGQELFKPLDKLIARVLIWGIENILQLFFIIPRVWITMLLNVHRRKVEGICFVLGALLFLIATFLDIYIITISKP